MAMFIFLDVHEREIRRALRRERIFRVRIDPFDNYDDVDMFTRYRFTRLGCIHIIDRLHDRLDHPTRRNHPLPASLQVFIALRFYASGSKSALSECASLHGCSKATASRAVRRVSKALCKLRNREIVFPTRQPHIQQAQRDFFAVAGFPGVVGAVDGTLIGLHGCYYGPDEFIYVSRKGRHAINVQLICNAHYKITNVVARWPGSTHDSRILQKSYVGVHFENGNLNGILLGDSGYPLKPWLMTPVLNPAETAYNDAHARTRSIIEQVNGQLKNKFRCLLGDGMQITPTRACDIIVACCVLFNISKDLREPQDHHYDAVYPEQNVINGADDDIRGTAVRTDIINNFFN